MVLIGRPKVLSMEGAELAADMTEAARRLAREAGAQGRPGSAAAPGR